MRILNLEPEFYNPQADLILRGLGEVQNGPLPQEALRTVINDIDILILRLGHQISEDLIDQAKNLKIIVTATTGLNHIDVNAAKQHGIEILSLQGERRFLDTIHATAEHTMALLLSLIRKIPAAHDSVMNGTWNRNQFKGVELAGKTMGILGLGRLGTKVANYAKAFGMNIIAYDVNKDIFISGVSMVETSIELARLSDIISIHITSTPENFHFVGKDFFVALKEKAIIINTARGDVMDQSLLLDHLKSGRITGAALDVLEEEYIGNMEISPLIQYGLEHDNLLITPHIGGATIESMHKTELFMANKLKNFVSMRS